jgi:pyruvate formate lyase activating enzyme
VRPAPACATERGLRIGGVAPFSATDFPGRLAAVVFCQGCPWDCRYCQNPHLIPRAKTQVAWTDMLAFLKRRRRLLDGVVFSGGEPTLQTGLREAMRAARLVYPSCPFIPIPPQEDER